MDDLSMPRSRHTAKRVYEVAECGYEGAYPSVQRWVKRWRDEHRAYAVAYASMSSFPSLPRTGQWLIALGNLTGNHTASVRFFHQTHPHPDDYCHVK